VNQRRLLRLLPLPLVVACTASSAPPRDPALGTLRLLPGFTIELFARVPGARSLALGPPGIVFVGTRDEGSVHVLQDRDGDGRAERVRTLATGLTWPNGVAFREGSLYVAELRRIVRFDGVLRWLSAGGDPPRPVVVLDGLPAERHHGWKYLRFGPDGKLYFGIGAPCNVCVRDDPFASLARVGRDGSGLEVVARGIRNTVGFDWHPKTGELWFTDNGADRMGDDVPGDELNRVTQAGRHFGFPYCHEGRVADPRFGRERPCSDFVPPVHRFGAHVAALGMRFADGGAVPEPLRGRIVVAQHGSWNRSTPVGYRVVLVDPEGKQPETTLAEGWLREGEAWGRPVDVELLADGSLLVSDDEAGAVYRIRRG
jgi:glucose/arabinose dehydrogenase